jgi:putative peptidoglycan lipid II flippase
MTPLGVIGMAISTAAFPTLAEQAARADDTLATTLGRALRLILFLSLPAGVGLALLARPLVVVLLQRGAFDAASSKMTADALVFYATALFAHAGIEILSRGFYALGDTRTPVAFAIAAMLLNLALAALLLGPLELRGLALALSIATTAEFICLLAVLSRRVPGFLDDALVRAGQRMLLATTALGLTVGLTLALLTEAANLSVNDTSQALAILTICTGIGGLVYLFASLALALEEPRLLIQRLPWPARSQG